MNSHHWITIGALLGALGVALGAFGAHGLEERLERRLLSGEGATALESGDGEAETALSIDEELARGLDNYETAVRYHMYHALALVLVGLLAAHTTSRAIHVAGWAFLLGIALFSGLLYVLVFTGVKVLGALVPIGGTLLIAGWIAMAIAAASSKATRP